MRRSVWENIVLVVLLLGVLFLTSCSRPFVVTVEGNLEDGVVFRFHDSDEDAAPSEFRITQFGVYEIADGGKPAAVWRLEGGELLSSVTYGKAYRGLREVVPAGALMQGVPYMATATAPNPPYPIGYAQVNFTIDGAGQVIIVETGG
jgi:hypothetical protein